MTLTEWLAEACAELDLDPAEIDAKLVLDLARDVAHNVERPAAPVTAYLLGLAVARGADPADAARRLTARSSAPPD
jgi:uncharacterized protein DUF6457